MADEREYIVQDGVVIDPCTCEPVPPKMEKIKVEQVVAAGSAQRVLEFNLTVPPQKPPIRQVVKFLVKNLEVTNVKVIPNKVIITGEFDVKLMYVADLPDQPVHAVEIENYKFTKDIALEGIRKDMDAEADVVLEYSDYDFECEKHPHKHKHDSKYKTGEEENCHHHPHEPCDPRLVRLTLVLKVWAKVFDYIEMEVLAQPLVVEEEDGTKTIVSASDFEEDTVSAAELEEKYEPVKVEPIQPGAEVTTVSGTATVTADNVNVRSGPGVNFPVVAKVSKGTKVTLREIAFGWYRVTLPDNRDGWIAGWLLRRD
jgi:hypothetical protein